jgi:HEAT repeat protein
MLALRGAAESDEAILRLLSDRREDACEAMAAALLELRREAAIPLLLRSVGRQRASGQILLESLLDSELDDVDVRGTIVSVLLDTSDRDEVAGALSAVGWLAPSGGFPGSPAAHARVQALCDDPDEAIRVLAQAALVAFAAR